MSRLTGIHHILKFLMNRKRFWLVPIVMMLLIIGTLVIFTQGSIFAPFVYTLF
ncbi:MAG: DUF5989 family protein [Patescibacteria group bacterium]